MPCQAPQRSWACVIGQTTRRSGSSVTASSTMQRGEETRQNPDRSLELQSQCRQLWQEGLNIGASFVRTSSLNVQEAKSSTTVRMRQSSGGVRRRNQSVAAIQIEGDKPLNLRRSNIESQFL